MVGNKGGLGKIIALVILLAIVGVIVIGIFFSGNNGTVEEEGAGDEPGGDMEAPSQGEVEQEIPYIVSELDGRVVTIFRDGSKLYLGAVEDDMKRNKSYYYLYIINLFNWNVEDKIKVLEDRYGKVYGYEILSKKGDKLYFFRRLWKGGIIFIPLVGFTTLGTGSEIAIREFNIDSRELGDEYRINLEAGFVAVKGDTLVTFKNNQIGSINLTVYDLDGGEMVKEASEVVSEEALYLQLSMANQWVEDNKLKIFFVGITSDFTKEVSRVYHIFVYIDLSTRDISFEHYMVTVYGSPLGIYSATASVDSENYYVFTAYSIQYDNKTIRFYNVQARALSDGSLIWEYEDEYTLIETNSSAPISSYVKEGVFYVSWGFLAAFRDGQLLWVKSPWGGKYPVTVLFLITTTAVKGGVGFYDLGDSLYIFWMERVEGSGVKGALLYSISSDGYNIELDLLGSGYELWYPFTRDGELYIASPQDNKTVLVRLV